MMKKNKTLLIRGGIILLLSCVVSAAFWLLSFSDWAYTVNSQAPLMTATEDKPQLMMMTLPFIKVAVLMSIPFAISWLWRLVEKWLGHLQLVKR